MTWKKFRITTYEHAPVEAEGTTLRIHDEQGILTVQVYDRGVWTDIFTTPNPRLVVDRL
jgi:hypothetical protein